jgi:TM2 domain-containing membrane protein YozV
MIQHILFCVLFAMALIVFIGGVIWARGKAVE